MFVTAVSTASLLLVLGTFFLVTAEDLVAGDGDTLMVTVLVLGPIAFGGTVAGTNLHPLRWNLLFPLYGALTLSRWLTMKSCRAPVFPPEIEAECAIDPADRYRLPEPSFMAEFADTREAEERSIERYRQRQQWR